MSGWWINLVVQWQGRILVLANDAETTVPIVARHNGEISAVAASRGLCDQVGIVADAAQFAMLEAAENQQDNGRVWVRAPELVDPPLEGGVPRILLCRALRAYQPAWVLWNRRWPIAEYLAAVPRFKGVRLVPTADPRQ